MTNNKTLFFLNLFWTNIWTFFCRLFLGLSAYHANTTRYFLVFYPYSCLFCFIRVLFSPTFAGILLLFQHIELFYNVHRPTSAGSTTMARVLNLHTSPRSANITPANLQMRSSIWYFQPQYHLSAIIFVPSSRGRPEGPLGLEA